MPKFVSVVGKWHPGKEVVQLPMSEEDLAAGKNPVYIGPDRGALSLLVEQGYAVEDADGEIFYNGDDDRFVGKRFKIADLPGRDAFTDPELIRMARTLGYKTVAEYLDEMFNIKREEIEAKSKSLLEKTQTHKNPDKKPGLEILGGGEDKSGQRKHRKGGFGEPDDVSQSSLKQRA